MSQVYPVLLKRFTIRLKKHMQQGICNLEFYGDLVYKFKKICESQTTPIFSDLQVEKSDQKMIKDCRFTGDRSSVYYFLNHEPKCLFTPYL